MTRGLAFLVLLAVALARGQATAQEQVTRSGDPAPNSPAFRFGNILPQYATDAPPPTIWTDVITTKHVRISGPLAHPLKARKLRDLPRRLFRLINPFAPAEEKEGVEPVYGLSPRPWTSMVGWQPGGSSEGGPLTHESSMGLISVSGK